VDEAGGLRGGTLHRPTPHETDWYSRCCAWQGGQNNGPGHIRALSARQGEPDLPGTSAEPAMALSSILRIDCRVIVSDFTYVSTWQGFVYVAFVIDTFADRIVGPLSADLLCKSPAGQRDGSRRLPKQTLPSMLWSRHFMIEGLFKKAVRSTIRTAPLGTLLRNALSGSGRAIFVHSVC